MTAQPHNRITIRANNDELFKFLEGLPELFKHSLGIIKAFEEFTAVELCNLPTIRTGVAELTVFLKPSKMFLDFVATVKAGNVERYVVEHWQKPEKIFQRLKLN